MSDVAGGGGKRKVDTVYKRLHINIEDRSGLPVYRQVMDQIQQYVVIGALESGDQLPSIRELSSQIAVNPQTIVKAYSELEHGGVVEMRRGRGAFIASGATALAGLDYEKQLRERMKGMIVEAMISGLSAEKLGEMFENLINETSSLTAVRDADREPELKIIGGGTP